MSFIRKKEKFLILPGLRYNKLKKSIILLKIVVSKEGTSLMFRPNALLTNFKIYIILGLT